MPQIEQKKKHLSSHMHQYKENTNNFCTSVQSILSSTSFWIFTSDRLCILFILVYCSLVLHTFDQASIQRCPRTHTHSRNVHKILFVYTFHSNNKRNKQKKCIQKQNIMCTTTIFQLQSRIFEPLCISHAIRQRYEEYKISCT